MHLSYFPLPHQCVQFFHYVRFKQTLVYLLYAFYVHTKRQAPLRSTLVALARQLKNRYAIGPVLRHLMILQCLGLLRACTPLPPSKEGLSGSALLALQKMLFLA